MGKKFSSQVRECSRRLYKYHLGLDVETAEGFEMSIETVSQLRCWNKYVIFWGDMQEKNCFWSQMKLLFLIKPDVSINFSSPKSVFEREYVHGPWFLATHYAKKNGEYFLCSWLFPESQGSHEFLIPQDQVGSLYSLPRNSLTKSQKVLWRKIM